MECGWVRFYVLLCWQSFRLSYSKVYSSSYQLKFFFSCFLTFICQTHLKIVYMDSILTNNHWTHRGKTYQNETNKFTGMKKAKVKKTQKRICSKRSTCAASWWVQFIAMLPEMNKQFNGIGVQIHSQPNKNSRK